MVRGVGRFFLIFFSSLVVVIFNISEPTLRNEDLDFQIHSASTTINRLPRKLRLRHCLIAPVASRCHQRPVPLAKALVFEVRIIASSVDE